MKKNERINKRNGWIKENDHLLKQFEAKLISTKEKNYITRFMKHLMN